MVFRLTCIQEFLRGLKIAKLLRQGTLPVTNRPHNPKNPGESNMTGNLKSCDVYRQHPEEG